MSPKQTIGEATKMAASLQKGIAAQQITFPGQVKHEIA